MLKGFVSGEEKDIKRIPMKTRNLFDYVSYFDSTFTNYNQFFNYADLQLSANTTYTLSTSYTEVGITPRNTSFIVEKPSYTPTTASGGISSTSPITITTGSDGKLRLYKRISGSSEHPTKSQFDNGEWLMLNLGSTPLPYEPYGYQEGWEVRDSQDRLIWGREDELQTATGTLPFKGYALPVKVKSLLGNAVQNGTPSPQNIVTPEMCGVSTGNLFDEKYAGLVIGSTVIYQPIYVGAGTFTLSSTVPQFGATGQLFLLSGNVSSGATTGTNDVYKGQVRTATAENGYVTIGYRHYNASAPDVSECNTMLNSGSTALPYSPYGWKVPFENHGENLFDGVLNVGYFLDAAFRIDTTGTNYRSIRLHLESGKYTFSFEHPIRLVRVIVDNTYFENVAESITEYTITITNDNYDVGISFRDERTSTPWDDSPIMLNSGSSPKPYSPYLNATIPVYLGEVPTVRRIKKVVFTGQETWTEVYPGEPEAQAQGIVMYSTSLSEIGTDRNDFRCSHFFVGNYRGYLISGQGRINGTATSAVPEAFTVNYNNGSGGLQNFKAWLADEYAAGHPVTLWYALATEQTSVVNEPLCKISTYADELTTIQVHGLSAPLYGIGDYKDTLNLSTGVVTRKVKKLVLTGTEDIRLETAEIDRTVYYLYVNNWLGNFGFCTHIEWKSTYQPTEYDRIVYIQDGRLFISLSNIYLSAQTVQAFKSYLVAQYQNGTPVTIWYVLNTPETETVTVPTGMTGEIEGYLTQVSTPSPTNRSVPKWNGEEETGGTYAVAVYTPPEIPTTTGQNTLTVDSNLAPYEVTVEGHIKYGYWGKIREDVRSGAAQTKFPVGTIFYDNGDETTGTAFQVVGYDKHFDPEMTERGYTHSMTLCELKLTDLVTFDATEALLYVETAIAPGTYKFKIPNYDATYGGNKSYYFTTTKSIPVGGQITINWPYQQTPKTASTYSEIAGVTAIESGLTLSEWIEGDSPAAIDLGTAAGPNAELGTSSFGKMNHIHRARYGSNNYLQSGIRQYINSDKAANSWWSPQTVFDRPYGSRTSDGKLTKLSSEFVDVLVKPTIKSRTNNYFEADSLDGTTFSVSTDYTITTDKMFLLSPNEVGLNADTTIGSTLDYYLNATDADRIKYRASNNTAYYWWLRTPYPTLAHNVRHVYTSGALHNHGASDTTGVAAACVIQ